MPVGAMNVVYTLISDTLTPHEFFYDADLTNNYVGDMGEIQRHLRYDGT